MGNRLVDHLVDNNTNEHLQKGIYKYGLENFTFLVPFRGQPPLQRPGIPPTLCGGDGGGSVEFCDPKVLLQLEQHYLDILFSLPANLRYNFLPTAGSSLGYKHTEEALAKLSEANSGALNPMNG